MSKQNNGKYNLSVQPSFLCLTGNNFGEHERYSEGPICAFIRMFTRCNILYQEFSLRIEMSIFIHCTAVDELKKMNPRLKFKPKYVHISVRILYIHLYLQCWYTVLLSSNMQTHRSGHLLWHSKLMPRRLLFEISRY